LYCANIDTIDSFMDAASLIGNDYKVLVIG